MSTTSIARGNALANKELSEKLSVMAARQPTPLTALTGPMPTEDRSLRKLRQQTTTDMPIVRVDELTRGPGDTVQVDCAHVAKLRAVMGDKNASGLGAALKYSTKDIYLDMATIPVSAGGKMTQKRTPHNLRLNALAQLKGAMPRFRWQRALTLAAGARGKQNGTDWILPLESDPEFAEQMVNAVKAPTYNRHFVANGAGLDVGGARLASIATTDGMKLSHIDEFAAIWDEMTIRMSGIQITGDPAAGDDPIKGILYVDPLVWDSLQQDNTAGYNIRTFEQNALKRADYGDMRKHPLFSGAPIMINGILIRKMNFAIRFDASDAVKHVTQANRLTAAESDVVVAAGLSTTHQVSRSIFFGAQGLALVNGANMTTEETYSLLEDQSENFGRNLELAGELMGTEDKLRWALPNASGQLEMTDFGIAVIDSVVKKRNV